jgi:SanA protein
MKHLLTFNKIYFLLFIIFLFLEIAIAAFLKTGFIRYTFGDYLVVILLYCFIKSFFSIKPTRAATIALLIAYGVETLQFFNLLQLLGLESNTLAKLILGSTFHFEDIIAYTLGIFTILLIEYKCVSFFNKRFKIFFLKATLFFGALSFVSIIFSHNKIVSNAENKTFNLSSEIPKNKVGVVLGASKYVKNGRINLFYKYRVDAAVALYKAGKIDFVLVSGDNGSKDYDEPSTFKEDLIARGIPEEKIYLDYAGFRTLDSMIRAKEIFGQDSITVISQKFHNERAIYLANRHDIYAIGFNAKDVNTRYSKGTHYREYLARTKAVLDIIIGTTPKFLGKEIAIK